MRNLLAFLAALLLTVVGLGWYLDWFKFASVTGGDGHRQVTIDINTNKISKDIHHAEEEVQEKLAKDKKPTEDPTPATHHQHKPAHAHQEADKGGNSLQMRTDITVPDLDKWLEKQ
jgi:hypothetical protein